MSEVGGTLGAFFGSTGGLDPIEFDAKDGDTLRIIAETDAGLRFLDPLTLECPDDTGQELTDGVPVGVGAPGTFFDELFVIGRP